MNNLLKFIFFRKFSTLFYFPSYWTVWNILALIFLHCILLCYCSSTSKCILYKTLCVLPSQADLTGIKWRRHYAESGPCYDPLDDPVLSSFSKCLSSDVLCVWRRVGTPEQHRRNLLDGNHLNHKKELWIFWYGEEPDTSGMVSQELAGESPLRLVWGNSWNKWRLDKKNVFL